MSIEIYKKLARAKSCQEKIRIESLDFLTYLITSPSDKKGKADLRYSKWLSTIIPEIRKIGSIVNDLNEIFISRGRAKPDIEEKNKSTTTN